MLAKNLVKKFMPFRVLILKLKYRKLRDLSNKEVFSTIYKERLWDTKNNLDFDSGPGSHTKEIVEPYISEVQNFLKSHEERLTVIDIGCGDFNIGKNLVEHTRQYIGVDVVSELIERNKNLFKFPNLKFMNLDVAKDPIPQGDCVLIREVLQHLTNADVSIILKKVKDFKYIIITENIPLGDFKKNLDKLKGPNTRFYVNSGLVIEEPPFNFSTKERSVLLKIKRPDGRGYIVTTLYQN